MDELLEDRLRPCAAEGGGLAGAEAELELLVDFLETQDFKQLRADQPDLAGGRPLTVELHRDSKGCAVLRRL